MAEILGPPLENLVSPSEAGPTTPRVSYISLPHKSQLLVLLLSRFAEPLAASSIQSYIFFQLQHFDPAASAATIAWQAGLIVGSKTAAHVLTGLPWGRLADSEYCGRKPVLLIGLLGSAISILGYGFSQSFAVAITWQILDGILNSSVPIIRCMTAELYSEKRERARALTLLPLCANAGHLLGPLLGGFLAFPDETTTSRALVSKFPFAPPNIFIASLFLLVVLDAIFILDETLKMPQQREPMVQHIRRQWHDWSNSKSRDQSQSETAPLLSDASSLGGSSHVQIQSDEADSSNVRLTFRQLWTRNVINTMLTYFIISGHVGTFPSLWAIFLSTPAGVNSEQHPPFELHGGLGMNPKGVGTAMSLQGVIGVITQVLIYPTLADRFGTLRLWRAGLFIFPVTYLLAPFCLVLVSLSNADQAVIWIAVLFILFLFVVGRVGTTPATTMLINDCTPHPSVRATIHTIATVVSSLSRSIFPPIALAIFGQGLAIGMTWIGFWFISGLAALACVASFWVREG